jgi:hypothetical protein
MLGNGFSTVPWQRVWMCISDGGVGCELLMFRSSPTLVSASLPVHSEPGRQSQRDTHARTNQTSSSSTTQ